MSTWIEIRQRLESQGNVMTVTMEELREANESGKLGIHVRSEISKALRGMGIGHVPVELPSYQQELVRLFKLGTPVGDLISTVLTPGQATDVQVVEALSGDDSQYAEIIAKIRDLVEE